MLLGKSPSVCFPQFPWVQGSKYLSIRVRVSILFPFQDIFLRGLLQASMKSSCLRSEHMCIHSTHPWMEHAAKHKLIFSVFQQGL